MPAFTDKIAAITGANNCLTDDRLANYSVDFRGSYRWRPLAVARPRSTAEVAALVKLAAENDTPIVPFGGNTGLNGGTAADGALMISMERMNKVREIRPEARVAFVDAGVVLSSLHDAVAEHGLAFPMTFGARGSAQIGGCLSTNAGGSNVLRHGNARALALGLEVVLPDGEVLDLMTALHKDNTGYDLRDLFIGAEGTLGLITGAVLKLSPAPAAYATAMVGVGSVGAGLTLLNRLQEATGGMVEAFEYMPESHMAKLAAKKPVLRPPLGATRPHTILVELAATAPDEATPRPDGSVPLSDRLEDAIGALIEEGLADDAVVAGNLAQRREFWAMREASAEVVFAHRHVVDCDVALPLDEVEPFLDAAEQKRLAMEPGSSVHVVSHLGDGNIHYTILPEHGDATRHEALRETIEDIVVRHRGSFSAEHGIGISKLGGMARRKDKVALRVMRQIKQALDPKGLMNPGKMLP